MPRKRPCGGVIRGDTNQGERLLPATVGCAGLEPELRENVLHDVYPAGHMMYLHYKSLVDETNDTRAFYKAAPDNTPFIGDR